MIMGTLGERERPILVRTGAGSMRPLQKGTSMVNVVSSSVK